MSITDKEDHSLITTNGIHLSRRLGEALKHAYQGDLNFTYGDAEKSSRKFKTLIQLSLVM